MCYLRFKCELFVNYSEVYSFCVASCLDEEYSLKIYFYIPFPQERKEHLPSTSVSHSYHCSSWVLRSCPLLNSEGS